MAETNLIFPIAAILLIGVLFSGSGGSSKTKKDYGLDKTIEIYSPAVYRETSKFQFYKEPDIDIHAVYERVSKDFMRNPDGGRTYLGVTDQVISKVHAAYGSLVEAKEMYRLKQTSPTETRVINTYNDLLFFTRGSYNTGGLLVQLKDYAEDILQQLAYVGRRENYRFPGSKRFLDEKEMEWLGKEFNARIGDFRGIIERCALLEAEVRQIIDAQRTAVNPTRLDFEETPSLYTSMSELTDPATSFTQLSRIPTAKIREQPSDLSTGAPDISISPSPSEYRRLENDLANLDTESFLTDPNDNTRPTTVANSLPSLVETPRNPIGALTEEISGYETPPDRKTPVTRSQVQGVTLSLRKKNNPGFDTTKKKSQIQKSDIQLENERLQDYRHSDEFKRNIREAIYRPQKPLKPDLKEYLDGTMKDPLTVKLLDAIRRKKAAQALELAEQIIDENPLTTSEIMLKVDEALEQKDYKP